MVRGAKDLNPVPDSAARDTSLDWHIGNRIRIRRVLLGMTMRELAEVLHITHAQLQYYESGSNRLSASTLYNIATALGLSIEYFFQGWPPSDDPAARRAASDSSHETLTADRDGRTQKEVRLLIQAFQRVGDPKNRAALLDLMPEASPEG